MFGKRMIAVVPAVVVATALTLGGVRAAVAQAEINALVYWDVQSSDRLAQGCRVLGYTLFETASEGPFIAQLQSQSWDFVGIELPQDSITQKALVAQLLEDHVATGGRLIVNYNHLNEWPRLQRLMGLESVTSIDIPRVVLQTEPPHVIWDSTGGGLTFVADPWVDSGDLLTPAFRSSTLGVFITGESAIVSANRERTIVNGFDWETMGGSKLARQEVAYLMSCRADFDKSTGAGVLDIFDFLRFQDLFFQQDPLANMNFDSNFDVFDFLAFQNAFVTGCN
jgi:hypothetical protein